MYDAYKNFLLSDDLFNWLEWASALKSDDVQAFEKVYNPFDESNMLDPIELAIAYDSENIFKYLIATYDYSDFFNQMDLPLLVLLLIFEREHFLFMTLDAFEFSNDHLLDMYEYIILYKDLEYFEQVYQNYNPHPSAHKDLLRIALNNHEVFNYLARDPNMRGLLTDESIMFDMIAYHPELLTHIEDVKDLSMFQDTDLFMHVSQQDTIEQFEKSLHFLLKRGFDINTCNSFGLNLFHQTLRYAKDSNFVKAMVNEGAIKDKATQLGYPPSHQLILKDAQFTIDLSEYIDFNAKDENGLTLQSYDTMMRSETLNYFDILSMVKAVLNMDESYFYELSEEEFYQLASLQGVEVFMPYATILSFESPRAKEAFVQSCSNEDFEMHDIIPLKDMFPKQITHDVNKSLQFSVEFWNIDETLLNTFKSFCKAHNTTVKIESEGVELNQKAHIEFVIDDSGKLNKRATVYTHLLDVYYFHYYFGIPLENIEYLPTAKKPERFLN